MNSSGGSESLDILGLPGIRTTRPTLDADGWVIEAETVDPKFPICCLAQKLVLNGGQTIDLVDFPWQGRPVKIALRKRQAKCKSCDRTGIYEELPYRKDGARMTERLYKHVMGRLRVHTFAEIARDVGVVEGTIPAQVHKRIKNWSASRTFETPRVFGVDEKLVLGSFRGVVCDIERRQPLDLLKDRRESLIRWLHDLPNRKNVEVVTMDMHDPYRLMVTRELPLAHIVVDKWHVVRRANDALEEVRKGISKTLRGSDKTHLMRKWRILLRRWGDLDDKGLARVHEFFALHPTLKDAYWAKERFFDIYTATTPKEAKAKYATWHRTLPPTVARAFYSRCMPEGIWHPYIFNYFDHRFTNSYVESLNRKIDDLQRDGRGYSFEVMRFKLLAGERDFRAALVAACPILLQLLTMSIQLAANDNAPSTGNRCLRAAA